jgi:hypothetical protein
LEKFPEPSEEFVRGYEYHMTLCNKFARGLPITCKTFAVYCPITKKGNPSAISEDDKIHTLNQEAKVKFKTIRCSSPNYALYI